MYDATPNPRSMSDSTNPFNVIDFAALQHAASKDRQLLAFCQPTVNTVFAIQATPSPCSFLVRLEDGKLSIANAKPDQETPDFILQASHDVWGKFLQTNQELGFQSFWAMYLPQNQIVPASAQVQGDQLKFAQMAPVWRRFLDIVHALITGGHETEEPLALPDEDNLVGRYAILDLPKWGGKCKVYYEQSGQGEQDIIFLHTAGSDGRQYHGVMNDARMLARNLRMTVFDLPSHGRSFPPDDSVPGEHYNSEDRYIEIIAAMIKKLSFKKTIVCGASMAGLICLAVALRNDEVGAYATIPVQGCEFVDMDRMTWDKHPEINQSLLVPEFTYGMMSPTSPTKHKDLVWHTYSAQAFGMYAGDLDFYFGGFDYRGKLSSIDTKKIRVAMLTGEYDWSCRPEMSLETASKIEGVWIKIMKGLGHFPATENPKRFVDYLVQALDVVNEI